jgi:UDP-N-acetylglucosamine--N-acetylmuramyl-(pentapeptide) pyrophosphoryl-undecaprenol N-acetylglucosamine transferase
VNGAINNGTVLIMAGGTGGHIFPGLAVADELQQRGVAVHWLGASGGMECEQVPRHGVALSEVHISGLRGKGLQGWLTLPFRLFRAVREASSILRKQQPQCAVSFGGYVAGPGGIAAWLRGVPLVVHEQNCIPGMTNKALARIARCVLQAFPGAFPASKAAVVGNPVREAVTALAPPEQRWAGRSGPARILITGGSQGARALNERVPEALGLLRKVCRPLVRHQTGSRDLAATKARYDAAGLDAELVAFIDDMAEAYAWADLVICRSGALTVSELAAAGLGAVLVPFPHAVDDHQTANARFLHEAGAALLLQENQLSAKALADELQPLLLDRAKMLHMAQAARSQAVPDAAAAVADACMQWVTP